MFADGIGKLDGNYHIRLESGPSIDPVPHAPRRSGGARIKATDDTERNGRTGRSGSCDNTNSVDIVNGGCAQEEWEVEDLR